MDTRGTANTARRSLTCFNGATAFRRWKPLVRCPVWQLPVRASMGPPPFGDGDSDPKTGATVEVKLQWGLSLSAMDTGPTGDSRDGASDASMGPPPKGGGYLDSPGPAEEGTPASMGPPPKGGGYSGSSSEHHQCRQRFNGATAFRRWIPLFADRLRCILMQKCGFPQEAVNRTNDQSRMAPLRIAVL